MKADHQPRESAKPPVYEAEFAQVCKMKDGRMPLLFRCHCGTSIVVTVCRAQVSTLADDMKSRVSD